MIEGEIGGIKIGDGYPVRIIGAINLSKESFYAGSVTADAAEAVHKAEQFVSEGADIIDIGGMSTAPYRETWITEEAEISRLRPVITELSRTIRAPISVDTYRPGVARMALETGATIINDVSGLGIYPALASVISEYDASVITCARLTESIGLSDTDDPLLQLNKCVHSTIKTLREAKVNKDKIAIDPCIGFSTLIQSDEPHRPLGIYRQGNANWPFWRWDSYLIANLGLFREAELPIIVGVSRKSFIRRLCGIDDPARVLFGSVAAEALAVNNGAHGIRTHNPSESRQAIRVAESIKGNISDGGP